MSFNTSNGVITGVPVGLSTSGSYTVTGTNATGSNTYNFNMSIELPKALWGKSNFGNARDVCKDSMNNYYALIHSVENTPAADINGNGSVIIPATGTGTYVNTTNIVKFNNSGVALWCKTLYLGAINGRISCDSSDNVYLGINYIKVSSFFVADINGNGSVMLPTTGSASNAIIKFNSSGVAQWVKCLNRPGLSVNTLKVINDVVYGGYGYTFSTFQTVATAENGVTRGPVDLNGDGSYVVSTDLAGVVLIRYNTSGTALGFKMISEPTVGNTTLSLNIQDISVDSSNNIFVTGNNSKNGTVNLNAGGTITIPANASATNSNVYLIKFNSSFEPLWCKSIQGNLADTAAKCVVDTENNIYISGSYNSTTIVSLGNELSFPATSSGDGYVIKYSSAGVAQWYKIYTATDTPGTTTVVEVDSYNNVYTMGGYGNTNSLEIAPGVTLSPTVGFDGYIVKYNKNGTYLWHRMINSLSGTESVRRMVMDNLDNICVLVNLLTSAGLSGQIDLNGDGSVILPGTNSAAHFGLIKFGVNVPTPAPAPSPAPAPAPTVIDITITDITNGTIIGLDPTKTYKFINGKTVEEDIAFRVELYSDGVMASDPYLPPTEFYVTDSPYSGYKVIY